MSHITDPNAIKSNYEAHLSQGLLLRWGNGDEWTQTGHGVPFGQAGQSAPRKNEESAWVARTTDTGTLYTGSVLAMTILREASPS